MFRFVFYESESGTVVKLTINSGTRVRQTAVLSQLSLLTRNFWSVRKAFLSVEAANLTHKETRFKSQGMALSLAGRRQHSTKTEIFFKGPSTRHISRFFFQK